MLKRLELIGFKSFADRTTFDFVPGITAIVGPNGSGKSNVVDAVRWILGEQSAKSLRGGEMADVIFNGSSSRKSLGMAEVTMTFDNRPIAVITGQESADQHPRRPLAIDMEEVQITRRVYRDGEGEYLINGRLCRLKDIKDLFLGSGAGTSAYCIIEQGRVDALLQASTKDRRIIFEEAAGISRFKAKKIETLRKLEKVEQNLQRLTDIVNEVDKQLRATRLQAAKAERYQEYSRELQRVRVALSLQEYHRFTVELAHEQQQLDLLRAGLSHADSQVQTWESELAQLEATLTDLDTTARQAEARLTQARQEIASIEALLSHESGVSAELEQDLSRTRRQRAESASRIAALELASQLSQREWQEVSELEAKQAQACQAVEAELSSMVQQITELRRQVVGDQAEHLESMRQAARLQNQVGSLRGQAESLARERDRLRAKTEQATQNLATVDLELAGLTVAEQQLQARLGTARQSLAGRLREREQLRIQVESTSDLLASLRALRSERIGRIEVLEGLERTQEGLDTGVREVVAMLSDPQPSEAAALLATSVIGLVADLITVPHDIAPLIDLALADSAQRFVVRDMTRIELALQRRGTPLSGRVGFIPLRANGSPHHAKLDGAMAHYASLPTADRLVRCERVDLADLPRQLLGNTLIVPDLATARQVAATLPPEIRFRYVTRQGELLDADGTLIVGTQQASAGILSRKAELREQREQVAELDARIATVEAMVAEYREQCDALDEPIRSLEQEIAVLTEEAGSLRGRIEQHRKNRDDLHRDVTLNRGEMADVEAELAELSARHEEAKRQAEQAELQTVAIQQRLEQNERLIRSKELERANLQQQATAAQIALAQVKERVAAIYNRHHQLCQDLDQRRREAELIESHLAQAQTRLAESQLAVLRATAAQASEYAVKERAQHELIVTLTQRETCLHYRRQLIEQTQSVRSERDQQQSRVHTHELAARDLEFRRTALCERLREDYAIDLAAEYAQCQPESIAPVEVAAANEQIESLKRKLKALGTVNLESLDELAAVEKRAKDLQTQLDDLNMGKRSLQEIITQINTDSRRLFGETFANVRGHFQELFRKLFGGGMADIVLEDESDILESGIEVVARPPGKELRSISLMSGGEKTLTAVALLLAIFRNKPSPFCLLDEVDAALDEANTARLATVLREFLDRSHFIIITHKKRTMAAADVLYGITMQESGISRQVSVRFEDWPEDGSQSAA